jgi:hypothetical protein
MSVKKWGLLAAFLAPLTPALAQVQPGPIVVTLFPPALQSYLELSAAQVASIQRLNGASAQLQTQKLRRSIQVQSEIAQETAKPTLDAMALGIRYLELEAIRRDIAADNEKTQAEIEKVLNDAQKTKVQALVAAMRLQGVICEAQSQNILPSSVSANIIPASRITGVPNGIPGFASFLLGVPTLAFRGCSFGPLGLMDSIAEQMPR